MTRTEKFIDYSNATDITNVRELVRKNLEGKFTQRRLNSITLGTYPIINSAYFKELIVADKDFISGFRRYFNESLSEDYSTEEEFQLELSNNNDNITRSPDFYRGFMKAKNASYLILRVFNENGIEDIKAYQFALDVIDIIQKA